MSNCAVLNEQSTTTRLLQSGDIIRLEKGMCVYTQVPGMFIYANCPFDTELHFREVVIGSTLNRAPVPSKPEIVSFILNQIKTKLPMVTSKDLEKFVNSLDIDYTQSAFDTSIFAGEYTVVSAMYEGAGVGHGPKDQYPSGWFVTAKKEDGTEVRFYQSGSFTAVITDIEPINK